MENFGKFIFNAFCEFSLVYRALQTWPNFVVYQEVQEMQKTACECLSYCLKVNVGNEISSGLLFLFWRFSVFLNFCQFWKIFWFWVQQFFSYLVYRAVQIRSDFEVPIPESTKYKKKNACGFSSYFFNANLSNGEISLGFLFLVIKIQDILKFLPVLTGLCSFLIFVDKKSVKAQFRIFISRIHKCS